jgi:O-antigen biosynthesis protein WbqP
MSDVSRTRLLAKRIFDLVLAGIASVVLLPLAAIIAIAVLLSSPGPILYWSQRVGRHNRLFAMPKFRSMRTDTPEVATHLLTDSRFWITPVGRMLRKTSLDELPQLWCILRGDMSFVGPRPALHNQDELILLRTEKQVHQLSPGLTGWAQVNGRDELSIPEKVSYDVEYYDQQSLAFDLKIILLTAYRVLTADGVRQADTPAPAERRRAA